MVYNFMVLQMAISNFQNCGFVISKFWENVFLFQLHISLKFLENQKILDPSLRYKIVPKCKVLKRYLDT